MGFYFMWRWAESPSRSATGYKLVVAIQFQRNTKAASEDATLVFLVEMGGIEPPSIHSLSTNLHT